MSLVLPHQVVALRLHILDIVVIFGEGGVKPGLHGGHVLPRLQELIF
jgi:hypothetical protein